MADFKQSSIYQIGVFHAQLGKLLMDPKTDMKKLTDFCHKYNTDFQFQFMPITLAEDPACTTTESQITSGKAESTDKPTQEQAMAGYAVACKFGVLEARAFKLVDEMYAAFDIEAVRAKDRQIASMYFAERNSARDAVYRYREEVKQLEAERDHWKANHANVVARLKIATERPDLPIDRIPAIKEMERLQKNHAEVLFMLHKERAARQAPDLRAHYAALASQEKENREFDLASFKATLSPAQQEPACETCKGNGVIGGWVGQTAESGGYDSVDCPDCNKEAGSATDAGQGKWPTVIAIGRRFPSESEATVFFDRNVTDEELLALQAALIGPDRMVCAQCGVLTQGSNCDDCPACGGGHFENATPAQATPEGGNKAAEIVQRLDNLILEIERGEYASNLLPYLKSWREKELADRAAPLQQVEKDT